ncbi:hypothetical protein FIV42_23300 [Persicimonas caeni]|uniref:Uncharacterized protein n=1 Tax=Persicimonas caeni TaxID=2292766 RepID=A0A4Y6PZ24_PERCE|nr:hypothetical protein [Persicimonas caeni]QDG53562.1 hypothetical protein FIV42_23300 [Persicimonas caeni]QED34783.1 hypothetical protein FRD00_23295 [Persicimonas caeni]
MDAFIWIVLSVIVIATVLGVIAIAWRYLKRQKEGTHRRETLSSSTDRSQRDRHEHDLGRHETSTDERTRRSGGGTRVYRSESGA